MPSTNYLLMALYFLTYRNGKAMTWQNGRELATLTRTNSASSLDRWEYAYDVNGQRKSKTEKHATSANGSWTTKKTTQYYYDGIKLVAEKKGGTIVWYDYDETGSPVGMRVNGQDYLFKKNIQGDVEGLYNSYGEEVVTYTYNSWGKVTEVSGDLASTVGEYNSLRYRGYYYDSDTGLYYLNSRYYDPETCRFVNADNQLSTSSDMTGTSLYAYCGYDPINRVDPTGEAWWHWALGALVVAACAVAVVATAGGAAAGIAAVAAVGNGMAAATTASTIAAGAFIGSATVYGMAALNAAASSNSVKEFNSKGNWGTVTSTLGGAVVGGASAYASTKSSPPS